MPEEWAASAAGAYEILYELIGHVQAAKAMAAGDPGLEEEVSKLIEASNGVLELVESLDSGAERPAGEGKAGQALPESEPKPDSCLDVEERLAGADLPPAPRPGRILVVDDDPLNREILSRHLARQGHEVCLAADGKAALEMLAEVNFDVMILDVMMPGINGYRLLELVKGDDRLREVRVIVISALADTESVARCIQLGAEDYLPREFEPVVLKARIESCLERKRLGEERELYVEALLESQERLRSELRRGAAYVRSLLPPRLDLPGMRSDWMFIPSASLGGDAFGYNRVSGGRLALYLLDVSGHGIEAALFSVTVLNLLKAMALPGADFSEPASVLSRLNESFRMEEQNNLYFTAWYGVYDPSRRSLSYASAGSPPAVLVLPGGGAIELASGGAIVGMDPDTRYATRSSPVPPNSRLYLFSDGAYEFRTRSGGILGLEPFIGVLSARVAQAEGEPALDGILSDVHALASGKRFEDDVSLVEFRFD
jgi:sigma-B regulation protein RsbU (phosphoserine phosphatase)